jgi:hypothetical protein
VGKAVAIWIIGDYNDEKTKSQAELPHSIDKIHKQNPEQVCVSG